MQHTHLKTLTLATGLSLALCASPVWSGVNSCKEAITANTPNKGFTAHGDGTVTHHKTGLMWKVCSEGQTFAMNNGAPTCTGTMNAYNWQDALKQAESATFAGKSDWRLPNINELNSIVETRCASPAINASVFPSTASSAYWSSSPYASRYNEAWGVNFSRGNAYSSTKYSSYRVRLVRSR